WDGRAPSLQTASEVKPMLEIAPDVVATKRQHGEGVTSNHALLARCRGGGLRTHRRSHVDALFPASGLGHKRNRIGTSAAKNKGSDWDTLGIIPSRIDDRVLIGGDREAGIRVCGLSSATRRPVAALPINAMIWFGSHAFPPHIAIVG